MQPHHFKNDTFIYKFTQGSYHSVTSFAANIGLNLGAFQKVE